MRTQLVLQPPARSAVFLVLTVARGSADHVRSTLADAPGLTRSVSFRAPDDGVSTVIGIGAELWDRLYDVLLRNMFIGRPPGTYDRILDFSTAQTGALFFVPTTDFLENPQP